MRERVEMIAGLILVAAAVALLVHCQSHRAPAHRQGVDAAQPETRP